MARGVANLPGPLQEAAFFALRGAALPLLVASPGMSIPAARGVLRRFGALPFNRKRVQRAESNIRAAFPDWPEEKVRDYALGSYGHLAALALEFFYGPRLLTEDAWFDHVEIGEVKRAVRVLLEARPVLLITGHVGNWEVLGYTVALLGFPMHGIYRPLDLRPADRWLRETRARRGQILVDKFTVVTTLPGLVQRGVPAGLVADQNGGDRGVFVPFFNRLTSTYKSIGLLALQFNASIICGFAIRPPEPPERGRRHAVSYRMEVNDVFGPAEWSTHPDPLFYLTARYRRGIERMIRRVPDQYDWLHRVWRSRPPHERAGKPFPAPLREKIRLLPWITDADLARIEEQSARDARTLAETGSTRLS